jgi:hypothetical protein
LERLVIHKNQFKGSSQYYSAKHKLDLEDLKELLTVEEKREDADHKIHHVLEEILSDNALEVLLGRGETIDGSFREFTVLSEAQDEKNNVLTGI